MAPCLLVTKSSPPSGGGSEKQSDGAEQPTTRHLRRAGLGRITLWKSYALIRRKKHLSYYGDRGSKTVKANYRRVFYRAWGLSAHRGWARLLLDRRNLVQAPNAPRDQSQHPRARNDYDEETDYESYMNPDSVPPTCSEERRQLEPELAFRSKFASAKAAHVLFSEPPPEGGLDLVTNRQGAI